MKFAYYVIIVISVVSKLTATYVEPSEELARITKQGHTKLTKRNEAITNNSGGAFERLPQENKEKIFNIKYERGRRVPIFECLCSGKNTRKLELPSYVKNLYDGNITTSRFSNGTMVKPQKDTHSALSKEKTVYGTAQQIRNQLMSTDSMRILNEINLDDYPRILIINSSRPPLKSSNPITYSSDNATDLPHVIDSFKQFGSSSQLLNSSSHPHIISPQHVTSNNFKASQKPPVKHKVTPSYFRNVVYPKYDEEPDVKGIETVSNNSFEDKSNKCNNVLVINAPKSLGGLPVVVVHNKNNNTVSLSLKNTSNQIKFKKYHPQSNEKKKIKEHNQPDKTGDLNNNNNYISAESQKVVPHLSIPKVVPYLPMSKVVPHLSMPKVPHLSMPKVVPHLLMPNDVPYLLMPKVVPHLSIPKVVPQVNPYLPNFTFNPSLNRSRHSKMTNIQREINRQLLNNLLTMMKKKIISRAAINENVIHNQTF